MLHCSKHAIVSVRRRDEILQSRPAAFLRIFCSSSDSDLGDSVTGLVANLPQRYDAICKQSDNE